MRKKNGYTLLEVVVTILIIGILASIAIPSIMNYVEAGNNQSRNNIARTLYMAAQGQLTQMKLTKNLSEFTEDLYAPKTMSDGDTVSSLKTELRLYSKITMPRQEKEENRNDVTYIIKDKGNTDTDNLVYQLLNPVVLDKSILNDTICVEFNARTGVVLSVFYSDVASGFAYSGNGDREDISGNRPYKEGAHRRQGYYGIGQTGELAPNLVKEQVDIIDGSDNRITDGALKYKNVLYGQILVPAGEKHYKVSLVKADEPKITYYTIALDDVDSESLTMNMPIASANNEKPAIYKEQISVIKDGIPYDRYIWIIDYISDGTCSAGGQTYSLYDNTSSGASKDLKDLKKAPVNLRLKLNSGADTQSDNGIKSLSFANSFFGGEDRGLILQDNGSPKLTDNYKIQSARHLNHIRQYSKGHFRQTADIDMAGVSHFEPIEVLEGSYTGLNLDDKEKENDRNTQYKIKNLSISKNTRNVGLFASVSGGAIRGISIVNGTIQGTSSCNIGAIAGEVLNGGTLVQSNSLSNVSVTNGQEVNAGGLVGLLSNDSMVNQCYNSGSGSVLNREHYGSVIVTGSGYTSANIGGLVGLNQGTIQYGYNNGRVNIDSVRTGTGKEEGLSILKEDGQSYSTLQMANSNKAYLGGIAGNNLGSISNTYANNFVGKTTNPDQCRNGGLVGIGNEAKQSYYLSNKTVDESEFGLNKILLSNRDFSVAFNAGLGYPPPEGKYPYSTLRGNKHSLLWEDIQGGEASIATTFKYYELYTDGSMGFSYGDQKKSTLVTNGAIVANDGYCIDFTYSNKYTLVIGNGIYDLTATGSMENPEWSWSSGNMTNLPIKITENGKSFFRLYLNNSVLLERANLDGSKPIKIQLISFGRKMLEGSSDKNSMGEETDVYFNPLFADAIVTNKTGGAENNSWSTFTIRSPRQLDNVDYVAKAEFKQTADIDFAAYKKELKITGGKISLSLNETDKVKPEDAIIKGTFAGTYSGESHYIRNVIVSMPITAKSDPVGLFAVVSGKVENLALIESTFIGRGNVGGLAGVVEASGEINLCQVSQVTAEGRISTGGVIGENKGTVTNVYFNTIKRNKDGVFESPVSGGNNIGGMIGNQLGNFTNAYTTTLGPTKENEIHPTVGKGSVGTMEHGSEGANVYYLSASGYNSNVKDSNSGIELDSLKPNTLKAEAMFSGNSNWENATVETTLLTKDLAGKAYPFAKLKGMNHYCDWPILVTTLKYYEKYSDGTFGYFYYIGDTTPANSLKYDPNLTVVEEGYFVELIAPGTYNVRFDNSSINNISNRESTVFEGRRVLKFTNKELEALVKESNIQQDGILPVKMEVSLNEGSFSNILFGTNEDEAIYFNPFFAKQIYVLKKGEVPKPQKALEVRSPRQMMKIDLSKASTSKTIVEGPVIKIANDSSYYYYEGGRYAPTPTTDINANPQIKLISGYGLNAEYQKLETKKLAPTINGSSMIEKEMETKQTIEYVGSYFYGAWMITNTTTTTKTTTTTTVESSVFGSNQILWAKGYDYNQTISLNFAQSEVDGRPTYTIDGETLPKIRRNVIPGLTGTYNGMSQGKVFRIYNLIMNVESSGSAPYADNTGATFGDIGTNAKVSNLEFVNPQIRYDKNGRGGGIVANINYGWIDNVKVYNTTRQSLFANINGRTDTVFCYSDSDSSKGYGHNHGGIAAQSIGPKPGTSGTIPRITNCVVGNNSNKIDDIADNDTRIFCYQKNVYAGEQFTNRIGGIVGFVYGESKIISCVNIAKLDVGYDTPNNNPQSPYAMGGIAGSIGVRNLDSGKTVLDGYYSSTNFKASPGYVIGCYNAGSLRLNNGWLGGIVGYPATNSVITSCYNTGRINIEDNGRELVETPVTGRPIRIGGIAGETDKSTIKNCYNVGYLSGLIVKGQVNSAAGAIMALPAYGNTTMESCYSLAADKYRPDAIVGKVYSGGTVNNTSNLDTFKTWVSRLNLRNNADLINTNKGYPVFTPSTNSFYLYPQLSSFVVDGVTYKNPHITPWEYIDAIYDTTLNYYERYQDGTYGYYYCDLKGEPVDQLSYDKTVQQDGYFLEIGKTGTYKVIINEKEKDYFTATTETFNGKTIIPFNAAMTQAFTSSGYQKVQLYTMLKTGANGTETSQDKEDNSINRIVGSTTILDGIAGIDLYFDPMFPKEIKYGEAASVPVKPKTEPYAIRGVRHLENIGKLTTQTINGTEGKIFKQETVIDFNNTPRTQSIISGEFKGSYNGNYKTIKNLTITGDTKTAQIGLFAVNKGTIEKLQVENPRYTGNYSGETLNLNMGIITAENLGQIDCVAIVSPQLKEAISGTKNIGGIAGINQGTGIIQDVYLIAKNTAPSPFSVSSNANAGGLIGRNEGYLGFSYYLAKAPVTNQPIMGSNTNYKLYFNTLCYLAGTSYNNFAKEQTIGTAYKTSEFAQMTNDDWFNWEKRAGYPYLSLQGLDGLVVQGEWPVAE